MPDLVVKNSDSCWKFEGGTLCNVVINDKRSKETVPASFIMMGSIKGVNGINHCWETDDGSIMCSVKAKGKDGGKNISARTVFNHHIEVPNFQSPVQNARSMPKCDPKTDPYCRV